MPLPPLGHMQGSAVSALCNAASPGWSQLNHGAQLFLAEQYSQGQE